MIYLFDRLYLDSDHYIRNDKKKMTAILGPAADLAKDDPILQSDFGEIQLDSSVLNEDLASYLEGLVVAAEGKRVTIFTTNEMIIKILAFYCSSIFNTVDRDFIKSLILFDKVWIDQSAGVMGHRDFSLRHKGTVVLDITNIDSIIDEAIAITPKITNYSSLRMEYLYASYLTNTLPSHLKEYLESTVKTVFYDANWLGPLVRTFSPMALTIAHKEGIDLDTFETSDLKSNRPEYYKIFDTAVVGDSTCFDRVELSDWTSFLSKAAADFGWDIKPNVNEFFTKFYENKHEFIMDNCLNPNNVFKWYCLVDCGKTMKINPHLWYFIAREQNNNSLLDKFLLKSQ